ncbi:MAG TPA: ATP synthase subunit I, partial [Alphaproteobacteria bacterium]|nr:ATP synthase subunit I [Alphaproteobacteria bacterium]
HGTISLLAGYGALGLALGLLHFASLRWLAGQYLGGGPRWRGALVHVARLALLGGTLVWIAQAGAWPLLAATAGLLAGRAAVMAMVRRKAA